MESECYIKSIDSLKIHFKGKPLLHKGEDLIHALHLPAILYPNSLKNQLEYLLNKYKDLLADFINIYRTATNLLDEEDKYFEGINNNFMSYKFETSYKVKLGLC